jgi:hypothetical protein
MNPAKFPADWREREASYAEVIKNHPDFPPLIALKIDVLRRGIRYTDASVRQVDPAIYATNRRYIFTEKSGATPVSLILRDGTSIFLTTENNSPVSAVNRDPYVIDYIDGRQVITDQGEIIEEVDFWRKPDYYDQITSSGVPMWQVVSARPQRLDISVNNHCHFWDKPRGGCKYCVAGAMFKQTKDLRPDTLTPQDVRETIAEALKQKGRYSAIMFTGGSILSGRELLDDEVDLYIEIIKAVGDNFAAARFPGQLISTAFNLRQLERIYRETKILCYTADIEVLNEEKFNWICPGKAEFIGFQEWKKRLFAAVDIFGRGYVNTGVVNGVELAAPHGFKSEAEALSAVTEEMEDLVAHGVGIAGGVWGLSPLAVFRNQLNPSLEYYVQVFQAADQLHKKYKIPPYMDDYRRCGSHPNTDLGRI